MKVLGGVRPRASKALLTTHELTTQMRGGLAGKWCQREGDLLFRAGWGGDVLPWSSRLRESAKTE